LMRCWQQQKVWHLLRKLANR
jgi:TonB dependent receptor.